MWYPEISMRILGFHGLNSVNCASTNEKFASKKYADWCHYKFKAHTFGVCIYWNSIPYDPIWYDSNQIEDLCTYGACGFLLILWNIRIPVYVCDYIYVWFVSYIYLFTKYYWPSIRYIARLDLPIHFLIQFM